MAVHLFRVYILLLIQIIRGKISVLFPSYYNRTLVGSFVPLFLKNIAQL